MKLTIAFLASLAVVSATHGRRYRRHEAYPVYSPSPEDSAPGSTSNSTGPSHNGAVAQGSTASTSAVAAVTGTGTSDAAVTDAADAGYSNSTTTQLVTSTSYATFTVTKTVNGVATVETSVVAVGTQAPAVETVVSSTPCGETLVTKTETYTLTMGSGASKSVSIFTTENVVTETLYSTIYVTKTNSPSVQANDAVMTNGDLAIAEPTTTIVLESTSTTYKTITVAPTPSSGSSSGVGSDTSYSANSPVDAEDSPAGSDEGECVPPITITVTAQETITVTASEGAATVVPESPGSYDNSALNDDDDDEEDCEEDDEEEDDGSVATPTSKQTSPQDYASTAVPINAVPYPSSNGTVHDGSASPSGLATHVKPVGTGSPSPTSTAPTFVLPTETEAANSPTTGNETEDPASPAYTSDNEYASY